MSKNLRERALWTLAQGAVATLAVLSAGLPPAYIPLAAALLSAAKTAVKEHLDGRTDSEA